MCRKVVRVVDMSYLTPSLVWADMSVEDEPGEMVESVADNVYVLVQSSKHTFLFTV